MIRTSAVPKSLRLCRRHPSFLPTNVDSHSAIPYLPLPSLHRCGQRGDLSQVHKDRPSTGKSSNSSSSSRAAAGFCCGSLFVELVSLADAFTAVFAALEPSGAEGGIMSGGEVMWFRNVWALTLREIRDWP